MKRFVILQLILVAALPMSFTAVFLWLNHDRGYADIFIPIGLGMFFSLLLALSLSWLYIKKLSSYIHEYAENARAIAHGNFSMQWPGAEDADLRSLEDDLAYMAGEIERRENELRESERRIKTLTYNVPGAVFQFVDRPDHQFQTEFFGDNITRIFGLDPDPGTVFRDFCEHVPADEREQFVSSVQQAIEKRVPWNYEGRFIKSDGTVIWFSGKAVSQMQGEAVIHAGVLSDITASKRFEESLRITQFSFDHAEMGIFRIAPDAGIVEVNRKAADLLGYTKEELVTKTVMDIDANIDAKQWEVIWKDTSQRETKHLYTSLLRKDGTAIVAEIYSNRLEYGGKQFSIIFVQDITERKQVEDSLKLTQFCFDKASIAIFRIGEHGEILDANEEACRSLGYTKEEVTEMDLFACNPTLTPELWEDSKKILHEEGVITGESLHTRKNGEQFQVHAIINMVSFGAQDYYLLFCQDITERKEAEIRLRENQRLLNNILESMTEGILVLNKDFQYTIFNKNLEAMSNTSRDDVLGKTPWEAFDFVKGSTIETQIRKTMQGEPTAALERNLPQGWFNESFSPIKDDDDNIIGVVGVISDISKRKQYEHELQQLRNYLSNIIDSMPSALVGVDNMGKVTQWNKTAEEHTGISAEAARGKVLSDVLPYMSREMEKISTSIARRRIIHEQKRPGFLGSGEGYEELTIYPLIANGVEGAVIRVDDVSETMHLEEMMIQSEKMLSVGGLAAGMAHEINNPLAGMMQTAEVMSNRLGQGKALPANQKAAEAAGTTMESIEQFMDDRGIYRMLDTIIESGRRVASIVTNMLSFARKGESIVTYSDLAELIDKTLELAATDYDLKKQYDFKLIAIHRQFSETPLPVPCETVKIQQVLLNIFRNAAQAMQEAGIASPALVIRTFLEEKRGTACVTISDNGPGMDEATKKRVFEPFFTTKPVGAGTGLGLSVSYFIIVENHGGELSVESSPGKGTTFIIRLPLHR